MSKAANYVTEYITKPVANQIYNVPDLLDEAIIAMKARRTLVTFGTWYGVDFFRSRDTTEWLPVAPLNRIIAEAIEGNANSSAILSLVTVRTPPEHSGRPPPEKKLHGPTRVLASLTTAADADADVVETPSRTTTTTPPTPL